MVTSLVQRIREQAQALGFTRVGFAPAEPPESAPAFTRWLERGMAGEMGYMAKEPERRLDPRVYWPEARSIVACTLSYAPRDPDPEPGPLEGIVARYARTDDYHDVVKARLHLLGRFITGELPGSRYLAVVDTAAVLERAHAVRAGLGWFGKNAMLLDRDDGSYTVLGFVLIDRELPYDTPVTAHCGSCRRCIDACPTGAILEPGVVDGRRCVSYLTIELRGSLPRELRASLGGHVFGCDICQQVCPWVRHAGAPEMPGLLEAKPGRGVVSLVDLALEGPEAFAARWRKSPVKRAKRVGLARNAVTLLGSSPDREAAVATLSRALEDPEPLVRGHAAWALGRQGGAAARRALELAHTREAEAEARAEIEAALEAQD